MDGVTLASDRAQRIVEAMRGVVAEHGATGATFERVAREAGVSRGLLHYHFGTKERLLAEVVRRDCDLRMAAIDAALAQAGDADDVLNALVRSLEDLVEHDPGFFAVLFELFTISRRNQDVADELAELLRRTRVHLAEQLAAKRDEGTIELTAEPEAVASILFALADGLALRMLAEPEHDFRTEIVAAVACVRALVV
jgi:AcrR family transcriptional regulator